MITTHIKVNYQNEFRRFLLENQNFEDLVSIVRELYKLDKEITLTLKYTDEENEQVTFSSDVELATAIQLLDGNVLRVHVYSSETTATESVLCHFIGQQDQDDEDESDDETDSDSDDISKPHWKRNKHFQRRGRRGRRGRGKGCRGKGRGWRGRRGCRGNKNGPWKNSWFQKAIDVESETTSSSLDELTFEEVKNEMKFLREEKKGHRNDAQDITSQIKNLQREIRTIRRSEDTSVEDINPLKEQVGELKSKRQEIRKNIFQVNRRLKKLRMRRKEMAFARRNTQSSEE